MPRNGSGTYSLPAGNPVTSGTLIEASWANTTLSDLSAAMTDSLARSGEGGMTGPLRSTDGSVSVPSQSFVNETSTGFYRAGATDVRFAMAGVDIATLTTGGLTVGSTKVLALPDGTAAAPALTNTGDTNTGVFFPDADTVAVSTAGSERVRVNSTGNVLVSAVSDVGYKLHVGSGYVATDTTARPVAFLGSTDTAAGGSAPSGLFATYTGAASASARKIDLTVGTFGSGTYGALTFNSGAVTLDSAGTLSLNNNLVMSASGARIQGDFSNATQANRTALQSSTTNGVTSISALPNGSATAAGYNAYNAADPTNSGYVGMDISATLAKLTSSAIGSGTSLPLTINVGAGSPERLRFDTGGLIMTSGRSTYSFASASTACTTITQDGRIECETDYANGSSFRSNIFNAGSNNVNNIYFFRNNVAAGVIVTNSSAQTSYAASSDYRLKDNPQPLTGSGTFIDGLQPKKWTWKTSGQPGAGFIAHEVAIVSPSSVFGEKDAVDNDGNPVYQSMEYGSAEFIANIVAELQSLRARVAALEAA